MSYLLIEALQLQGSISLGVDVNPSFLLIKIGCSRPGLTLFFFQYVCNLQVVSGKNLIIGSLFVNLDATLHTLLIL